MFENSKNIDGDFFRSVMAYPEVAQDFLKNRLSADLVALINWDTLKLVKKSFIKEQFERVHSDVVFQCKLHNKASIYLYLLLDTQSPSNFLMPFRMLQYKLDLMEDCINRGDKYLPIVIGLCIYAGRTPCTYSENIYSCFHNTNLAREHVNFFG